MLLTSHTLYHPMLPEILRNLSLDFLRLSVLESLEDRETRFFCSGVHGSGLADFIVGWVSPDSTLLLSPGSFFFILTTGPPADKTSSHHPQWS